MTGSTRSCTRFNPSDNDDAYESREEVIDSFRGSTVPPLETEKDAMCSGRFSSGVTTDEEDIDEALYG